MMKYLNCNGVVGQLIIRGAKWYELFVNCNDCSWAFVEHLTVHVQINDQSLECRRNSYLSRLYETLKGLLVI